MQLANPRTDVWLECEVCDRADLPLHCVAEDALVVRFARASEEPRLFKFHLLFPLVKCIYDRACVSSSGSTVRLCRVNHTPIDTDVDVILGDVGAAVQIWPPPQPPPKNRDRKFAAAFHKATKLKTRRRSSCPRAVGISKELCLAQNEANEKSDTDNENSDNETESDNRSFGKFHVGCW